MTEATEAERRGYELGHEFRIAVDTCKTMADYESLVDEFASKSSSTRQWWHALGYHQMRGCLSEATSK